MKSNNSLEALLDQDQFNQLDKAHLRGIVAHKLNINEGAVFTPLEHVNITIMPRELSVKQAGSVIKNYLDILNEYVVRFIQAEKQRDHAHRARAIVPLTITSALTGLYVGLEIYFKTQVDYYEQMANQVGAKGDEAKFNKYLDLADEYTAATVVWGMLFGGAVLIADLVALINFSRNAFTLPQALPPSAELNYKKLEQMVNVCISQEASESVLQRNFENRAEYCKALVDLQEKIDALKSSFGRILDESHGKNYGTLFHFKPTISGSQIIAMANQILDAAPILSNQKRINIA